MELAHELRLLQGQHDGGPAGVPQHDEDGPDPKHPMEVQAEPAGDHGHQGGGDHIHDEARPEEPQVAGLQDPGPPLREGGRGVEGRRQEDPNHSSKGHGLHGGASRSGKQE